MCSTGWGTFIVPAATPQVGAPEVVPVRDFAGGVLLRVVGEGLRAPVRAGRALPLRIRLLAPGLRHRPHRVALGSQVSSQAGAHTQPTTIPSDVALTVSLIVCLPLQGQ